MRRRKRAEGEKILVGGERGESRKVDSHKRQRREERGEKQTRGGTLAYVIARHHQARSTRRTSWAM
jgi:hypothetical protein